MVLLFPHHPLSFYPPFSSKTSHPVKIVKDSIIFILGYLFKGLIIIVIKKSMLELAATVAWNAELIYYYSLPTLEKANRFTGPTRIWNVTRLDLVISKAIKIESAIQTRVFSLSASTIMVVIDIAITLRDFAYTAANSIATFLKNLVPFIIRKRKLVYDSKSFEEDLIHQTRFIYHGIPAEIPPKPRLSEHDSNRVTNNKKRIRLTEIFGEEEIVEDELVKT
jgi:hypothetical protein